MRVSGSYDLFSHHYIMPTFTHEEHMTAVNNKLQKSILGLNTKTQQRMLKAICCQW